MTMGQFPYGNGIIPIRRRLDESSTHRHFGGDRETEKQGNRERESERKRQREVKRERERERERGRMVTRK